VKCLGLVKDNLNLNEAEIEDIKEDLEHVEKVLDKYDINFQDTFAIGFYNHIVSFISRAKDGEFVAPIEEETISELTKESINIASEMLEEIFRRYKRDINKSEIYLVSIHIQVAMSNK
jgi:PRD domain protein (TIGR03582 family)